MSGRIDRAKLQRLQHASASVRARADGLYQHVRHLTEAQRDALQQLALNAQGLMLGFPGNDWGPLSIVASLRKLPPEALAAAGITAQALDDADRRADALAAARAELAPLQAEQGQRAALLERLEAFAGATHA